MTDLVSEESQGGGVWQLTARTVQPTDVIETRVGTDPGLVRGRLGQLGEVAGGQAGHKPSTLEKIPRQDAKMPRETGSNCRWNQVTCATALAVVAWETERGRGWVLPRSADSDGDARQVHALVGRLGHGQEVQGAAGPVGQVTLQQRAQCVVRQTTKRLGADGVSQCGSHLDGYRRNLIANIDTWTR